MHKNPYGEDLGDLDPYQALGETPERIRQLVTGWSDSQFERTFAPGKWSVRLILVHLAQTELALPTRARFALTQDDYRAQSFDQDAWLGLDSGMDARTALDAYTALRRMNVTMFRALTAEQRDREFTHPEYGKLSVGWIAAQMAGHDIHHLRQIESLRTPA